MRIKQKRPKIVVGMSGGVDSSVALLLLKKQGYEPIGVSLKYAVWKDRKNLLRENVCCSAQSFAVAETVCKKLGVPYYILDFSQEFKKVVMEYFLQTLKKKETPNPCAVCNRYIKFKRLIEFARKCGAEYVATGHYARLRREIPNSPPDFAKRRSLWRAGKSQIPRPTSPKDEVFGGRANYVLLQAKDKSKDQTYFLCFLTQQQLKRIIFPLGNYLKEEVYKIAQSQGFDFFLRTKQSQGLCFVSDKSIPFYLEKEIGIEPGPIIDQKGNVLGQHKGLHFYTIGQRKDTGIGGIGPFYVTELDKKHNALIVTNNPEDPALFKKSLTAKNVSWISGEQPKLPLRCRAKIRYLHPAMPAVIERSKNRGLRVVFLRRQRAITPGQLVVFYKGQKVLGGGTIGGSQ